MAIKTPRNVEMSALYEISKLLGASMNIKVNLRGVLRILSEYLDMKRGTVAVRHDNELSIVAAHGMSEEEIRKGRYKIGEGIMGRVAKLGTAIVIPDIGEEPLFLNRTGARSHLKKEDVAFLCVPIKMKNEVLGVLSVDRLFGSVRVSFEEDVRLLKIIASLIASSLKLHREIEKEREEFLSEQENLRRQLVTKFRVENMIGQSEKMQEVFEAVHRVAQSRATVLLRGESGTGKELVAKAVHFMSPRSKGPFVKFNCASIPEGLLESELFGHEKGAFTGALTARKGKFEVAHGGTVFLDEIGDLPPALQPKILRVLQEREFERVGGERTVKVDVRLIAGTSRDLEERIRTGEFREDLYFRLNVVPVFLPPLRERKEDIPPLVEHFLKKYNMENGKSVALDSDLVPAFMNYHWPGNVRELENTIERIVVMSKGKTAVLNDIPFAIREQSLLRKTAADMKGDLLSTIGDIEKEKLRDALEKSGWVHARAARMLGITPRQIGYKVKKYRIEQTR